MTKKKDTYVVGSSILKTNWVHRGGINSAPVPQTRPIPLGISGSKDVSSIDEEKKHLVKVKKTSKRIR